MLVPVKSFKTTTVYPIGPKLRDKKNTRVSPYPKRVSPYPTRVSPYPKNTRVVNVFVVGVNHSFEEQEFFDRLQSFVGREISDLFVYTEKEISSKLPHKKENALSELEYANTILEYFMGNEGRSIHFDSHGYVNIVSETTKTIKSEILFDFVVNTLGLIKNKYRDLIGCSPAIFDMIELEFKKLQNFEDDFDLSINSNSVLEYFFMSIFPYLIEYFSTLFEEPRACTERKKNKRLRKYDNEIFSNFKRMIESDSPFDFDLGISKIRDKTTVDTFEEMLRNDKHETNNIMFIFGNGHIESLTEKLKNLDLADINIKLNIGVVHNVTDVIETINKTLSFFGKPERRQSQRVVDQNRKKFFL